jgi:DNA repair protein RAD16
MQHFCHFNKHVLNPIKRSGYVGEGRKAMLKLKNEVPSPLLLSASSLSQPFTPGA